MHSNEQLKKTTFLKFETLNKDGGICTLFMDRTPEHSLPLIIWHSDKEWDHIIASYSDRFLSSVETELVKRFFFKNEEQSQVEIVPASLDEPRPYGVHLWLYKGKTPGKKPDCYEFIPSSIIAAPWMFKISPAYHMAVNLQAVTQHISQDEYITHLEDRIQMLFSDGTSLTKEDRKLKLCFYKKPSVECFFLTLLDNDVRGSLPSYLCYPDMVPKYEGGSSWKNLFDPLLYNAVIFQSNGNHISPQDYADKLSSFIERGYSGKDKEAAEFIQTYFIEKASVQSLFLSMIIASEQQAEKRD